MREILFRGKRIDNNQWIEGTLIATTAVHTKYYIVDSCWCESQRITEKGCADFNWIEAYEVIPETIGQYTSLTVPSGKIFEHDIVTAKFKSNGARFNFTVKYSNENGCYVFDNGSAKVPFNDIKSVRIIGNIHDNSELLKGGAE